MIVDEAKIGYIIKATIKPQRFNRFYPQTKINGVFPMKNKTFILHQSGLAELVQISVPDVVRELVQQNKLVSAVGLSKMTGLGAEHLLQYELRKNSFTDVDKVR